MQKRYVIIVAGGTGSRMGSDLPKQYLPLGNRPVLMHTIARFTEAESSPEVVLVINEAMHALWNDLCEQHHFDIPHTIAYGGTSRFQSVRNGLLKIVENVRHPLEHTLIAIHDAARPVISPVLIDRCFEEASIHGSTVLAVLSTNSVRQGTLACSRSIDRSQVWMVQTPQTFRGDIIERAFQQEESSEFTDDASVVEKLGYTVRLIPGDHRNIKITFPEDIRIAQYYLESPKI